MCTEHVAKWCSTSCVGGRGAGEGGGWREGWEGEKEGRGGGNGLRICPIVHSCSLWPAQTLLVGIRVQPPWRAIQTLNVELVTSVFNV